MLWTGLLVLEKAKFLLVCHFNCILTRTMFHLLLPQDLLMSRSIDIWWLHQVVIARLVDYWSLTVACSRIIYCKLFKFSFICDFVRIYYIVLRLVYLIIRSCCKTIIILLKWKHVLLSRIVGYICVCLWIIWRVFNKKFIFKTLVFLYQRLLLRCSYISFNIIFKRNRIILMLGYCLWLPLFYLLPVVVSLGPSDVTLDGTHV